MRFGYFGYDQRKTSLNRMDYQPIAFTEVNAELGGHERYKQRLHTWALNVLRTGGHEVGLFAFSYCEIDDDDEPGKLLTEILVAWDGEQEVTRHPTTNEV